MRLLIIHRFFLIPVMWGIIFFQMLGPYACAQEQDWQLPFQSFDLQKIYQTQHDWQEQCRSSAPIPYVTEVALKQIVESYHVNAQLFLLKKLLQKLKYNLSKMQLNATQFNNSFFKLTQKYCQASLGQVTIGDQLRQWWLDEQVNMLPPARTDSWVIDHLSLLEKQKYFTQSTIRYLDGMRDLCQGGNSFDNHWSLLQFYLSDVGIGQVVQQFLLTTQEPKITCTDLQQCHWVPHAEWVANLPWATEEKDIARELAAVWCHQHFSSFFSFNDIARNSIHPLRPLHENIVSANRFYLRNMLLGVADYFDVAALSEAASKSLFIPIKQQTNDQALILYPQLAQRVEWESPLEFKVQTAEHFNQADQTFFQGDHKWQVDLVAKWGEADHSIHFLDKMLVRDELFFSRTFLEWVIRQSMDINYSDSYLYAQKMETLRKHIYVKVAEYISQRSSVFKIWQYVPQASWDLVDWIIHQRGSILHLLQSNPQQQSFSLMLNYWTSFSVLEYFTMLYQEGSPSKKR